MKGNISANLLGGALNACLVLVVTPIHIRLLGTEAFGLISLIAALQIVIGALDLGLSATVTRAVARASGDGPAKAARLVNTATGLYWGMALAIGGLLWLGSDALADKWLTARTIPHPVLAASVQLIALFLAIRWPVALYASVLTGAAQMVRLNIVKSLWLAARMLGGVLLLFQSPDIVHLLLWYVATSVAELAMVAILAFRAFPELRLLPTYDAGALRRSFSFTASMSFITLLAVLLTQLDRLVIANVLGLEDMGRYAVAYNLALGLSLIQTAVNSAALPVYASAHSLGDVSRLAQSYATTSQLMGFLLSAPAIALVAYGHEILTLWVGAQMAAIAYPVLAVLTTGFWLNGAYSNSFIMGVAQGRPGMFVRINLIGLVFYALLLLAGVSLGNIVAVAAAWAGLNLFYVGYALRKAHGALELGLAGPWFMRSFGMFALAGAASFTAGRGITWLVGGHAGAVLGFASGCAIYCLLSYRLMLPELRDDLLSALSPTPRGTAK